ncbi:NAD(P)-dependent oxidoreductase [Sediminibacterium soli]|uniref:NAD(P)-dependent oxidoreductase n=1 Tax=Sediminibacterium soli TaxID=2698829 RepID=UPI001379439B|nr:NAD(P)H-binding protein [Sediminibacterium soli]NCI46477.1 NAD(P)H-binding protein [Sediminibacterium soli]
MLLTIFAANAPTGRFLVSQALANGIQVTAFDRQIDFFIDLDNRSKTLTAVKGYVFDESDVKKALRQADAVVSLIGGGTDGTDRSRSLGTRNIVQQMEKAGIKRLIALAGTPVLDSAADDIPYLMDEPDFPQENLPLAQEYLSVLQLLEHSPLAWTLICPPAILDENGQQQYLTSAAQLPSPDKAAITAGDLADCILQEIMHPRYIRQRVGISRI